MFLRMHTRQVKIGCCGFPIARSRYFANLGVVEIQKTFYEPPSPEIARRWKSEAPEGFEFTVKAWQIITHEATSPTYKRLSIQLTQTQKRQLGSFKLTDMTSMAWQRMLEIARILGANKVLFQCPASFMPTAENKKRMKSFFKEIPRQGIVCIWEPRGDWKTKEIAEVCDELNLVHCVDPLAANGITSGLIYWRLHGIGSYRHRYSDHELYNLKRKLIEKIETSECREAYVFFNNLSMWDDSLRMKRLLLENPEERMINAT